VTTMPALFAMRHSSVGSHEAMPKWFTLCYVEIRAAKVQTVFFFFVSSLLHATCLDHGSIIHIVPYVQLYSTLSPDPGSGLRPGSLRLHEACEGVFGCV